MSTSQTPNYGLHQWAGEDQFKRTDFNEDNAKLDAALHGLRSDLTAQTAVVDGKAAQTALDALSAAVGKKAEQSALNALTTKVNAKAEQSALNALTTKVNAKAEQSALNALTTKVNAKAEQSALNAAAATIPKVAAGTYTGDGAASRTISLGFTPKAVYVCPQNGNTHPGGGSAVSGGLAVTGGPLRISDGMNTRTCLSIASGGFTVYFDDKLNTLKAYTNTNGELFFYFAIG